MKKIAIVAAAAAGFALQCCAAAQAAGTPTIGALVGSVGGQLEKLPLPGLGTLGTTSLSTLGTLPGLSQITLPGIGGGVGSLPLVGQIPVSQAVLLVESLAPLQQPLALPGLPQ